MVCIKFNSIQFVILNYLIAALNISDKMLSYIFSAYDFGNDMKYLGNFKADDINEYETQYQIINSYISDIGQHLAIE